MAVGVRVQEAVVWGLVGVDWVGAEVRGVEMM